MVLLAPATLIPASCTCPMTEERACTVLAISSLLFSNSSVLCRIESSMEELVTSSLARSLAMSHISV